jgi:hypothetical protein
MAVSKQAFMLSVITQFWVIPQNSSFFKIKIKKNKIQAGNVEKADQEK